MRRITTRVRVSRRASAFALTLTLLAAMSSAPAAGVGAGAGAALECWGTDCIKVVNTGASVPLYRNGAAVAFTCTATAPTAVAITITACYATGEDGTKVHGLQNGAPGPAIATAGGSTAQRHQWYIVCADVTALFQSGAKSLSRPSCTPIWVQSPYPVESS